MKKIKMFVVMAIMLLGIIGVVSATPNLEVTKVEINNYDVGENCGAGDAYCYDTLDVYELNDKLEIDIKVTAVDNEDEEADDLEGISMVAYLAGYEYSDRESVMDSVKTFDLKEGRSVWKHMIINLPQKLDKGVYDLRVVVSERTGFSNEYLVKLDIDGADHSLVIKGVVFSPEKVIAGRSLLSYVRIKNYGDSNEETVRVRVSIPELGISASEYVDDLNNDDSISTEELYLRIPKCTPAGKYDVEVMAEYDEGYEDVVETYEIEVVEDDADICGAMDKPITQTIITVASETQDVDAGDGVVYPLTISNMGSNAKTYSVSVDGADFASYTVSPSNVMLLNSGEAKAIYVKVAPKGDVEAGEYMFAITIKSGGEVLKEIPLKANVVQKTVATTSAWTKVKKALEIGLVVLVVLLVILGLIIGFNKMKGDDDDDDDEGKTYY